MAHFLSRAWLDGLQDALSGVRLLPGADPVTIEQVVVEDHSSAVLARYRVCVGPDSTSVREVGVDAETELGPSLEEADVTLVLDLATATQIARGETNAERALASGRCRLRGHPERLAVVAAPISAAADQLRELSAVTEYRL